MSESDSIWRRPINPSRLRINDAGRTHCWPDWSWSTVGRPFSDFDLWVVLGGRGKLTTPGAEVSLFPAVCFLLRPEGYAGTTEKKNPLVVSHTHFDILDQGGHPWRPGPVGWPRLWRVAEDLLLLDGMLKRLFAAHLQSPNSDEARHWLSAALLEVARQDERDTGPAPQRELRGGFDELCARIVSEPSRPWSVAGLARRFGYSPDHFTRLFKQSIGMSPREYCVRVRLQQAAELLRSTDHRVNEIADLLGYSSVYFFSRQFKQRTGVSPQAWRRGRPGPRSKR